MKLEVELELLPILEPGTDLVRAAYWRIFLERSIRKGWSGL